MLTIQFSREWRNEHWKTCWHLLYQKFVAKWFCGDKGWCFFIHQSVQARPINGIIKTGDLAGSNPFNYIKPYRNHGKTRCIPAIGSVQVQCATVVVINISCNLLKPAPLCIDFECLGSDDVFFEDKTPVEIPVKSWRKWILVAFRIGGYLGGMLDKPRCSRPQKKPRGYCRWLK